MTTSRKFEVGTTTLVVPIAIFCVVLSYNDDDPTSASVSVEAGNTSRGKDKDPRSGSSFVGLGKRTARQETRTGTHKRRENIVHIERFQQATD